MSGDPKECREHARECLKKARSAPSLPLMAKFQSLAHSWLRLADDLERAEALRERLKAPTRKAARTASLILTHWERQGEFCKETPFVKTTQNPDRRTGS